MWSLGRFGAFVYTLSLSSFYPGLLKTPRLTEVVNFESDTVLDPEG